MSVVVSDGAAERVTKRRVVFVHPFTLGREPDTYAPGIYDVETTEQAIEAAGHLGHVRVSTVLIIPSHTGFRCREVSGSDLDDALQRDAEAAIPGADS